MISLLMIVNPNKHILMRIVSMRLTASFCYFHLKNEICCEKFDAIMLIANKTCNKQTEKFALLHSNSEIFYLSFIKL